jgi:acylglycerol lipase
MPVCRVRDFRHLLFPCLAAVPGDSANLRLKCTPNKEVIAFVERDPYMYKGRQRLGTALEMLIRTADMQQRIPQVDAPFFVLHGSEDTV